MDLSFSIKLQEINLNVCEEHKTERETGGSNISEREAGGSNISEREARQSNLVP